MPPSLVSRAARISTLPARRAVAAPGPGPEALAEGHPVSHRPVLPGPIAHGEGEPLGRGEGVEAEAHM